MRQHKLRTNWYRMTALSMSLICLVSLVWLIWVRQYSRARSQDVFELAVARSQQNLFSYLDDFEKVAKVVSYTSTVQTWLFESSPYDRMTVQDSVKDLFYQMLDSYSSVKDIVFLLPGNQLMSVRSSFSGRVSRMLMTENNIRFETKEPYYTYAGETLRIPEEPAENAYFLYVFPVYSAVPGEFHPTNSAICLLIGDLRDMPGRESADRYFRYASMQLMDGGQVILPARSAEVLRAEDVPNGWSRVERDGVRMLSYRTPLAHTGWEGVFLAVESDYMEELLPVQSFLLVLLAVFFLAMLVLMLLGVHSMADPIRRLMTQIRSLRFEEGRGALLPRSDIEEIDSICGCINDMIARMEQEKSRQYQMKEELYQATISAKQSLLQYYRSQINPHFLYNSLECIRSIAQLAHVEEICQIAMALARVFRYAISERMEVSLETELHNVEDYFRVIAVRKPNQYRLRILADEAARDAMVQRMLLQPLVENAIQHGFEGKTPPFCILIRGRVREDGALFLEVADNGVGIPEEQLEQLRGSLSQERGEEPAATGIGLSNICRRLNLAYGGAESLRIRSKYGYYTVVELLLPISPQPPDLETMEKVELWNNEKS